MMSTPMQCLNVQPHIRLAGDQVLVGQLDVHVLRVQVARQVLPLAPDQIRLLERTGSDGRFSAELWGQDTVSGFLHESVLRSDPVVRHWWYP